MRRIAICIIILTIAVAALAAGAAVLYQTDFEKDAVGSLSADWVALSGDWAAASGETVVLQQTRATFRGLAQATRGWSSYDVAATVLPLAGAGQWGVGLVGYWEEDRGCYRLSSYGNLLAIWRERGDRLQALAAIPWEPKAQQAYRFRLSLRNEKGGTWVRGRAWAAADPEPEGWALGVLDAVEPLRQGRPGLFAGRASAAFSDLAISGADGQTLVEESLTGAGGGGARYWRFVGGDWQLPADQQPLRQAATDRNANFSAAAYAVLGGWSNYTVQVAAKAEAGGRNQGFGLSAYVRDGDTSYQFGQLAGSSLFLARRTSRGGQVSLATVPFAANEDVWYALKLRLETMPEGVRLLGKAWPAASGEPVQWQIQAEDRRRPELRGGEVGVWCLDDVCSFDDLVVRGND